MAKKQKSFAEKASSKGGKDLVYVKYVKSVPSEKEGYWRFNESMVAMEKGSSLDAALKEMEDAANLVDIELPTAEEAPAQEAAEAPAKEESAEEAPAQEAAEAPAKEESAKRKHPHKEAAEAPAKEESAEEAPAQEAAEAPAKEESAEEAPAQEAAEAPAKEESAEEAPAQEDSKDKSS